MCITEDFLSCLSGSELPSIAQINHLAFLSCLSGSEHKGDAQGNAYRFSELPVRQ